jgi:hypothetical protein
MPGEPAGRKAGASLWPDAAKRHIRTAKRYPGLGIGCDNLSVDFPHIALYAVLTSVCGHNILCLYRKRESGENPDPPRDGKGNDARADPTGQRAWEGASEGTPIGAMIGSPQARIPAESHGLGHEWTWVFAGKIAQVSIGTTSFATVRVTMSPGHAVLFTIPPHNASGASGSGGGSRFSLSGNVREVQRHGRF